MEKQHTILNHQRVEWSEGHLTPTGIEERSRSRRRSRGSSTSSPWKASARSAKERSKFSLLSQSFKGAKNDSSDFILSERVVPAHPKGSKTHTDQPPKSEMKRRTLDSNGKRGMIETPEACRGGSTPSPWKASARSAMKRSLPNRALHPKQDQQSNKKVRSIRK